MDASDPRLITYSILMAQIKPLLAGHNTEVQGIVLADLLAYWLAGHPSEVRKSLLTFHLESVEQLVRLNAREIRGDA